MRSLTGSDGILINSQQEDSFLVSFRTLVICQYLQEIKNEYNKKCRCSKTAEKTFSKPSNFSEYLN